MTRKKKRKTRQEKIVLQLKRELAAAKQSDKSEEEKPEPRQEAISSSVSLKYSQKSFSEKTDKSLYNYDPRLIKKDLLKTLILTMAALGFEFMLYLKLR